MVHLEEVLADKNISYERLDELVKTKLRDEQYREKLFADYESNLTAPEEDYNTFYATMNISSLFLMFITLVLNQVDRLKFQLVGMSFK